METAGELTATQTKQVLAELVNHGGDPRTIAEALGFEAMSDDALAGLVDGLIADHPDEWNRFVAGDEGERRKMQGFFTGQIMKATQGQADGRAVADLLNGRAG
jgi:aspartyl-tRNA(Asn)/glutamyl-tRNA(Gln) amidotransferase subunit B